MPQGTFVAVVGPSGAGKDTLIRAVVAARPDIVAARRVISRDADDATEVFDSVTPDAFAAAAERGDFVLHWQAHGLGYGIPASVHGDLAAGRHVLANLSRGAVAHARALFDPFQVILVTAPAEVLALRLADRGREDAPDIAARLARAARPPEGQDVTVIRNDGAVADALARMLAVLPQPAVPVNG